MKWHLRKLSRSRRCHGVVDASGGRSVQRRPGERPSSCRNRAAAVGSEGGPAVPNSGVFGSKRVGGGEGGAGRLRMSFTAHMDAVAAVFDPGGPRRRATVPTRVSMGFVGRGVDGSKRGGGSDGVRPCSARGELCGCGGAWAVSNKGRSALVLRSAGAAEWSQHRTARARAYWLAQGLQRGEGSAASRVAHTGTAARTELAVVSVHRLGALRRGERAPSDGDAARACFPVVGVGFRWVNGAENGPRASIEAHAGVMGRREEM